MGRPPRIQFAGAVYLVTLRGSSQASLFVSNPDRRRFLGLLAAAKERWRLKVYAYCLLPGRASLLIETGEPNLAAAMQALATAYAKYFGATHAFSGHLFQGRYRALLVDPERFLGEATRYVHLEPARAGLRESPWRYPWSSCSAYVQLQERRSWVDADEVLARFGKNRLTASVRYLKWLKERLKSASDLVLPVARGLAVGHESFLERALSRRDAAGADPAAQARQDSLARARGILAEVAARHGLDPERITGRAQWRAVCAARREAVHRIWKEARLGVTEIGRLFDRTPSAISQIVRARETGGA